jgi:hypothetical protein
MMTMFEITKVEGGKKPVAEAAEAAGAAGAMYRYSWFEQKDDVFER